MALSSAEAYSDLRGEATQLLNDIGQSLTCLLDAPASDGHAEAHIDLTKQLGAFFSCYYKLRKRLERDSLSVAVLALTKSGGSLLNWLDQQLPCMDILRPARCTDGPAGLRGSIRGR